MDKIYAGIDLHRNNSTITLMDERGIVISVKKIKNQETEKFEEMLNVPDAKVIAGVEATYGWYWMEDLLSSMPNVELRLGDATAIKKLSNNKKKTDKVDATFMSNLLRSDMFPQVHKASPKARETKELLRYRASLVKHSSSIKKRMRANIAKQNKKCPYADISGKGAREWIDENVTKYPYRDELMSSLEVIDKLKEEIEKIKAFLEPIADTDPNIKLLTSMPGIGKIVALTLVSEIDDISRFDSPRKLCSYAGLTPKVSSSGGKTHMGEVMRGNTYIKAMLAESFKHAIAKDEWLRNRYEKLKEKKGKSKAKVATMRSMLTSVYFMLKNNSKYMYRGIVTEEKQAR